MEYLLVAGAAFLAFSNGANDNFKGFATVWGSNILNYRQALTLATIATVLGSVASLVLAEALVRQFSGKGLVPDDVAGSQMFILSVSLGAAVTVMLAARAGLPVSTTHALIGGLVGAGMAQGDGDVNFGSLAGAFLLPLLLSPFIAATLGVLASRFLGRRAQRREDACACITVEPVAVQRGAVGVLARRIGGPRLIMGTDAQCDQIATPAIRLPVASALNRVHTLSAASICFARGVNDTPKLAALLMTAQAFDAQGASLVIAATMAAGGLMFSRRVARTMSQRMVKMNQTQGLAANLISAALILFASKLGMPVSTTHVAVGSIAGVGVGGRSIDWKTTRTVLLSWIATLPLAAVLAYAIARAG